MQTIEYLNIVLFFGAYKTMMLIFSYSLFACLLALLIGELIGHNELWETFTFLSLCFVLASVLCLLAGSIAGQKRKQQIENESGKYQITVSDVQQGKIGGTNVVLCKSGDLDYVISNANNVYESIQTNGYVVVFDYEGATYLARNQ